MTETLHEPAPAAPPDDPRRLVRDPDDKVVAGVCAAFGRYTDTDPVLWRVTVGVLAVFGGTGIALYLLGWLLVPRAGEPQSAAERLLRGPDRRVTVAGVVLLVLGGILLLALLDSGPGPLPVLVIGGIAYLVARERRERPPQPFGPVPPGADGGYAPTYGPVHPSGPPAPRSPSPLGLITLCVAALVTGLLLAAASAGVDGITAARVLAVALLVVGAGVLAGTWWGRARWLIPIGVVLALLTGAAAVAERAPGSIRHGVGERTWVPTAGDRRTTYELGAGEATLDLRELPATSRRVIRVGVGLGELVVLVPEDLSVLVTAEVDLGSIRDRDLDGRERDLAGGDDTDLREEFVVGSRSDANVELDLTVGVGEIEVRRVPSRS